MPAVALTELRVRTAEDILLSQKLEPPLAFATAGLLWMGVEGREDQAQLLHSCVEWGSHGLKGCDFCFYLTPHQKVSQLGRLSEDIRRPPTLSVGWSP